MEQAETIQDLLARAVREHQAGRLDAAEAGYKAVLAHDPAHAHAIHLLGVVEYQRGRPLQADELIRRAITLSPNVAEFHNNHGEILRRLGRPDLATEALRKSIALKPNDPAAHFNMGNALMAKADPRRAADSYDRAISLQPDMPLAHVNKGLALLQAGELAAGFAEYEWRWRCDFMDPYRRDYPRPAWDGSYPAGKTILLHWEQSAGDTIQFVRYATPLAERGAKVIVECPPDLQAVVGRIEGVSLALATGEPPPDFDFHAPLMSLPRLFDATLDTLPARVPYVLADPTKIVDWRIRLARDSSWCKVGLVWNADRADEPARSIPPAALAPLGKIRRASYYGLQRGPAAALDGTLPPGLAVKPIGEHLTDFDETAALIANLDLIVTADSAVAHLAGAMGKPVWVLLPYAPDWRWMLGRSTTPWYPTMSLVRQKRPGAWEEAVQRVKLELDETLK